MVITWRDAANGTPGALGGKAASLARLTAAGLPVPRWICVTAEAHLEHLRRAGVDLNGLGPSLSARSPDALAEELCRSLASVPLDSGLVAHLSAALARDLQGASFAVRSSALGEDAPERSFAGLFATQLHVPPGRVQDALLACWRSAFAPRVLAYLKRTGAPPSALRAAVIIQEMVDSRKSGILFQANPHGRLEEVVIVAGYGLGEGVVTGDVETDTYVHDRLQGTARGEIGSKRAMLVRDEAGGAGVRRVEVPAALRDAPVLSQPERKALLEMSARLARLYDHSQDVEWAFGEDGALYLLQSRPITTIPPGPPSLYDSTNVNEGFPGVVAPLTFSVARELYRGNFHALGVELGLSGRTLAAVREPLANMIAHIEGRVYYHLSNWHRLTRALPFAGRFYTSSFDEMVGAGPSSEEEAGPPQAGWGERARFLFRVIRGLVRTRARFAAYQRQFAELYREGRRLAGGPPAGVSPGTIERLNARFSPIYAGALLNDFYLAAAQAVLRRIFANLGARAPLDLLNNLLVGSGAELESLKPVQSAAELAAHVRASAELQEVLAESEGRAGLAKLAAVDPAFAKKLDAHLDRYGDRRAGELKLESPTLREEPWRLLGAVLRQARSGPLAFSSAADALRASGEEELRRLLPSRAARAALGALIAKTRELVRNRESARLDRARWLGLLRGLYLAVGQVYVARGWLERPEDVLLLTAGELTAAERPESPSTLAGAVKARRGTWLTYEERDPVDRMWLAGPIEANVIPQKGREVAGSVRGQGCCPGVVEGEALIVRRPDEGAQLDGRILVAESTDPGWVLLMMAARGLIVERGNILSHTSIVGRELGIPTIVGASGATRYLRSGGRVRMDGTTGVIEVV